MRFTFTSEHVSAGHPDKLCDYVSDSVLDACLAVDPNSKVACETMSKTNLVGIFGEITVGGKVDYEATIRQACKEVGYDAAEKGLDCAKMNVNVFIEEQSPDIAQGVHGGGKTEEELGAGDQGLMFGYATDETPNLMPLSYELARNLCKVLTELRVSGEIPWLRPDCKTQVAVEYEKDDKGLLTPIRIQNIVISQQHDETVDNETIRKVLKEKVVDVVCDKAMLDDKTIFHLNPSGRFVIGGPHGDAGLTGRKIIVDTYGGWGGHGGGAFSGKDPSKVDRSAAYAARWVAKSIVAAGLAKRAVVQVSYAIGVAEPCSVFVDSYGTGTVSDEKLIEIIKANFDLRPYAIIKELDLKRPVYKKTASLGHFGRDPVADPSFTWEVPKKLNY